MAPTSKAAPLPPPRPEVEWRPLGDALQAVLGKVARQVRPPGSK